MKEKKECNVVQDLLPNYIEGLTTKETNEFIEEHLKECKECQNVLKNMKDELTINKQKRDGREVDYIKKYNKKMKIWKKLLLIVFVLLVIYAISVGYKLSILNKIAEKNEESKNLENYYYYSIANDTLMEYFKKDGIIKMNVRQARGNGNITFWKDSNTGEQLIFWNETKLYDKAEGGILESTPASMFASPDSTANIMMAIHPLVFIGTQKYNDIECYNIKFNTVYEVISKDKGLLLYSNEENNMRNIQYKFNTVTDNDVAKPNLSEYTLNNKN